MKNLQLLIIASILVCVSGCELTGPSVKVEPPKVKVNEPIKVENGSHENGKFCPPGQAKKGAC